jgi:hypothetical protein
MSRALRVLLCLMVASATWPAEAAETARFIVFDSLFHAGIPDLRSKGMLKMPGSDHLWRNGVASTHVDPEAVRQTTRYLRSVSRYYFFDIENWLAPDSGDEQIEADVAKFLSVADIARSTAPDGKFGFYDVAPKRTYWGILLQKDRPDLLRAWRHMNDLSAPIAAKADFVLPSLYTFYNDPGGWETAAIAVLQDARRFGKPVYPVLTFEFHNSTPLAGKQIPREFWRRELEVTRQYADGVVLWGGYREKWDEKADWWLETQEFLKTLPPRPNSPTNLDVRY